MVFIERKARSTCARLVQPVQCRLGLDGIELAPVAQRRLGDGQLEVLGHVEVVDHATHTQADGILTAQRVTSTLRGRHDLVQIELGGREQLQPLARALLGQQRVATHDQPFTGEVRAGQLQQVALIEQ
jgi:hypothetical protein